MLIQILAIPHENPSAPFLLVPSQFQKAIDLDLDLGKRDWRDDIRRMAEGMISHIEQIKDSYLDTNRNSK